MISVHWIERGTRDARWHCICGQDFPTETDLAVHVRDGAVASYLGSPEFKQELVEELRTVRSNPKTAAANADGLAAAIIAALSAEMNAHHE